MFRDGKVLSRDERNYVMRDQSKPITLFPFVRHFIHAGTRPYTHRRRISIRPHRNCAIDPAGPREILPAFPHVREDARPR